MGTESLLKYQFKLTEAAETMIENPLQMLEPIKNSKFRALFFGGNLLFNLYPIIESEGSRLAGLEWYESEVVHLVCTPNVVGYFSKHFNVP